MDTRKTRKRKSGDRHTRKLLAQCHPRVKKDSGSGCLPTSVLKGALKIQTTIGVSHTGKNILNTVAKILKTSPKDQNSLLNALPISASAKEELADKWLRPPRPADWAEDPDMWLDTNNIRDVMKQYEESHKNFLFLGPHPIDFASAYDSASTDLKDKCLVGEMCSLDLEKEKARGIDFIGIVFNLDPHDKGGSHWIASFIDIPKMTYYYFDSYGMRPPRQVYKFMQWLTIKRPLKLKMNGKRFQRTASECGMFCMYFIVCMLEGETFAHFCRRSPSDKLMLEMRKKFYST